MIVRRGVKSLTEARKDCILISNFIDERESARFSFFFLSFFLSINGVSMKYRTFLSLSNADFELEVIRFREKSKLLASQNRASVER